MKAPQVCMTVYSWREGERESNAMGLHNPEATSFYPGDADHFLPRYQKQKQKQKQKQRDAN